MTVKCDPRVAGHLLDALQHLAGEDLAHVALAQLGALRIVVLVQLQVGGILVIRNGNHMGFFISDS